MDNLIDHHQYRTFVIHDIVGFGMAKIYTYDEVLRICGRVPSPKYPQLKGAIKPPMYIAKEDAERYNIPLENDFTNW